MGEGTKRLPSGSSIAPNLIAIAIPASRWIVLSTFARALAISGPDPVYLSQLHLHLISFISYLLFVPLSHCRLSRMSWWPRRRAIESGFTLTFAGVPVVRLYLPIASHLEPPLKPFVSHFPRQKG